MFSKKHLVSSFRHFFRFSSFFEPHLVWDWIDGCYSAEMMKLSHLLAYGLKFITRLNLVGYTFSLCSGRYSSINFSFISKSMLSSTLWRFHVDPAFSASLSFKLTFSIMWLVRYFCCMSFFTLFLYFLTLRNIENRNNENRKKCLKLETKCFCENIFVPKPAPEVCRQSTEVCLKSLNYVR